MKIYGLQKTTLLDYPEHLAASIFTGGCNFRCPFCQNAGLALMGGGATRDGSGCRPGDVQAGGAFLAPIPVPEEEVFAHLRKRRGILDGLCITGGEPTLQPGLQEFILKVKELGYAVKLDTNGSQPKVLAELLGQGLLDYVAMDIKASKENYARAAGLDKPGCGTEAGEGTGQGMSGCGAEAEEGTGQGMPGFRLERIEESIRLLRDSGIPYEFRTTAVKGLHTVEEFDRIGRWLAGCRAYFIQNYEEQGEILGKLGSMEGGCPDASGFGSFDVEELKRAAQLARQYIDRVELRGVT